MHQFLAGFVACLPEFRTCFLYRSNSWKQAAEFPNRNCFSKKIFFFFGSIQDCVSEILSIIKNMTWIYYGSQLQFLNTLVRLVSNIFSLHRDRAEEREHQTVISWGWMGEGCGQGHARMCELKWGPNVSDGIFELETFNMRGPASRNSLSAGKGLGVLSGPCVPVLGNWGFSVWGLQSRSC